MAGAKAGVQKPGRNQPHLEKAWLFGGGVHLLFDAFAGSSSDCTTLVSLTGALTSILKASRGLPSPPVLQGQQWLLKLSREERKKKFAEILRWFG